MPALRLLCTRAYDPTRCRLQLLAFGFRESQQSCFHRWLFLSVRPIRILFRFQILEFGLGALRPKAGWKISRGSSEAILVEPLKLSFPELASASSHAG